MKVTVKSELGECTIELTTQQIEQIKASRNKTGRFIPNLNELCYIITADGNTYPYTNRGNIGDINRIKIGNCFKTRQDAKDRMDTVVKKQEILDFIFEQNKGWTADWKDVSQKKNLVILNTGILSESSHYVSQFLPSEYYFKSGVFQELVNNFGNDLKHLFM